MSLTYDDIAKVNPGIRTRVEFERSNNSDKQKYGSYQNYLNAMGKEYGVISSSVKDLNDNSTSGDYTMNEVASVAETGGVPVAEPKNAYDTYMSQAMEIYNKNVEENNKKAENQAAIAGAQYREVNRNVNELNKANGKADTGYAGDTSISAYNAYRNSVNEAYANADSANNQLYSYYLDSMAQLQQAKDAKEASDRQFEQSEKELAQTKEYNDKLLANDEETNVVTYLDMMDSEDAYSSDGYILSDSAKRLWDYVKNIYGENVPNSVMAYLNAKKGFTQWLEEYNKEVADETYKSTYVPQSNEVHYKSTGIQIKGLASAENNRFRLFIDGEKYVLESDKKISDASIIGKLNEAITKDVNKTPDEQECCVLNGVMYVYADGVWYSVDDRKNSVKEAINAYLKG